MMDKKKFKQALRLLRSLHDLQNGAPLEKWREEWEDTMNEIGFFLAEHEQEDPDEYIERLIAQAAPQTKNMDPEAFMDEVRGREPENNEERRMRHGDLVIYKGCEIGRIKGDFTIGGTAWVVFNCGGDWARFDEYTAESTPTRNLKPGWLLKGTKWRHKKPYAGECKVEAIGNEDSHGYVKCRHYGHTSHPNLNEGIEHIAVESLIENFYQI